MNNLNKDTGTKKDQMTFSTHFSNNNQEEDLKEPKDKIII
jgi:hypothetical protein